MMSVTGLEPMTSTMSMNNHLPVISGITFFIYVEIISNICLSASVKNVFEFNMSKISLNF